MEKNFGSKILNKNDMKKQLLELFGLVEKWGEDRNFYAEDGTTAGHQFIKLIEEQGEMCGNIARGKDPTDDIGDQVVVLIHVARLSGNSFLKFDWELLQDNLSGGSVIDDVMNLTYLYGRLSRVLNNDFISTEVTKGILFRALVELKKLASRHNTTLLRCLEHSYNEIKDRKGKMVNSVYVKESDIKEPKKVVLGESLVKLGCAVVPKDFLGDELLKGIDKIHSSRVHRYRKLPVEIEAVEWTGRYSSMLIIEEFMGIPRGILSGNDLKDNTVLHIQTLEGVMFANVGDYIIKGVNGEFYPCKPDIFWKTYRRVEKVEIDGSLTQSDIESIVSGLKNPYRPFDEAEGLTKEAFDGVVPGVSEYDKRPDIYELAYESYHMLLELTKEKKKHDVVRDNLDETLRVFEWENAVKNASREEMEKAMLETNVHISDLVKLNPDFPVELISDGYHTFKELYEFRMLYNAALFNEWSKTSDKKYTAYVKIKDEYIKAYISNYAVHKSWNHHDGEPCFGGGWFIVSAMLPTGLISNHYKAEYWDYFKVPEVEKALFEFDGHTSEDVQKRLTSLILGNGSANR